MKSSCIRHPENEPLIIIRQWQVEFCQGNAVAAALMSFFEYWHSIKLEIADRNKKLVKVANNHGDEIQIDVSLYQWHTSDDLVTAIQGIAKSKNTINEALAYLESTGLISIHSNPNPKYSFDRTRYFIFHPEIANSWLNSRSVKSDTSSVKIDGRTVKNDQPSVNFDEPSVNFDETITEITTETTAQITSELHAPTGATTLAEFFGPSEHPSAPLTASPKLRQLDQIEREQFILLQAGRTDDTEQDQRLLQANWQPRNQDIKQALIAFLKATRLSIPAKKSDRLFWENELQEHVNTYGLSVLDSHYAKAAEEMRDRPIREHRPHEVMSIKSPKSVTFKLEEYKASKQVKAASNGYDLSNDPNVLAFRRQA